VQADFEGNSSFGKYRLIWKNTAGKKSNMCKETPHAKE
jgi:hypothetical protein